MKKTILVLVTIVLMAGSAVSQDPPPAEPGVVQTPFGPVPAPAGDPAPEGAAAEPTAGVQAQAEPEDDDVVPIELILDNQDIHQVIQIIGNTLGLNYIVDPTVQGTVNINTAGTLRRSDLLPILETILRINGATIVQNGNFYEIVPAGAALRASLPVQDNLQAAPTDDQFVIQILRMRFVTASEMSQLLTPYLTEGANIVIHDAGNILLINERRRNLRKLMEIVDVFDTDIFEGERVRVFPVERSAASDLVQDLETIFAGYALAQGSAIRFVAIERLNSVLVISPNATVFDEVASWLERLDQPEQSAGIRTFVYKAQNQKATDLQGVLSQLYGTQVQLSNLPQTPADGLPVEAPGDADVSGTAPAGTAFVPTGNVRIIADAINNALVIQATPQVYALIQETLGQLDVQHRQVLIDVQIYEVVLDDSIFFGLSAILQNRGTLQNPQTTGSFATPSGGASPSLAGQTFAFLGRSRELVVFLNASENRSRVRTLSAPSVLVSNNMTASFQVGAEVPIPTTSSITPVQSDGTNLFAQTIQFRPTGVIMVVTPQISESGNVNLEISQEVSQASANTTSGLVAPVIGTASVRSSVVVQDGQTIAIGGFIRESQERIQSRVPLLGRIPGLGVLFGSTSNATTRTELIVLITPHVIRNQDEADIAAEELREKLIEIGDMFD